MVVSLIALVVALSGTAMAAATLVNGDKLIKKRTLSGDRLRKHTITGKEIDLTKVNVPRTCENGSVAAVASWYTDAGRPPTGFPMDPNFTAPNQFGGEGGFACNGATPLLAKPLTLVDGDTSGSLGAIASARRPGRTRPVHDHRIDEKVA